MKPETKAKLRAWGARQAEEDWSRGAIEQMSMQGGDPFSTGYRRRYQELRRAADRNGYEGPRPLDAPS